MIKAIIVDNETSCCETLAALLKHYCPEVKLMGICHSGAAALSIIQKHTPQLLFLDVEMPRMNGFQLLEKIKPINFELILTANYDHDAIKAIHFSAIDYLLKPIDPESLQRAVQKAIQSPQTMLAQQLEILLQKVQHPVTTIQKIALPSMDGLQMIVINTIINCTSDSNYTVFSIKGNKKLTTSRTLKEIEALLEGHCFIRVHHSCIVNLNEIQKYIKGEGGQLLMSDGSTINVSRSHKAALLQALQPGKIRPLK